MDHPFDIEQDNNPSLYASTLKDDQFNNSLTISSTINSLLTSKHFRIEINKTEKLLNSSIIVYLIEIINTKNDDVIVVKRRYSEFKSFRDTLYKLFPSKILPPIPEKHSLFTYVWNSLSNNNEVELIEFRKHFFNNFLNDLMNLSYLNTHIFLQKFLDPNYELCWTNALMEPPINILPKNLLLSNPIDPLDQNGLYLLLPKISHFSNNHFLELYKLNHDPLSKLNDNILRLNNQISYNKFPTNKFQEIPQAIIDYEGYIHNNLQILRDLNKYNIGNIKNFKGLLSLLINLGGNLNNFSLEIYGLNTQLSNLIEKFGSIIDLNYLNYENFLLNKFIPMWYELINQIILYYYNAANLLNFYKLKIIQFKILYKTKFSLFNQLIHLNNNLNLDLQHLGNLNSPTIHNLIKNYESSGVRKKKSWYKVFGGGGAGPSPVSNGTDSGHEVATDTPDVKIKIDNLERELSKLNQLIDLMNDDLVDLTEETTTNLEDFNKLIERKWLIIYLTFIQSSKELFVENLSNWSEFKLAFA